MSRLRRSLAVAAAGALMAVVGTTAASAQVFGTFSWQMQPYCNTITLTLTSVNGNFSLDGSEDQCGAAKKGSASGVGVFNPRVANLIDPQAIGGATSTTTCESPTTAAFQIQPVTTVVSLNAGDSVRIRALQSSGGAASIGASSGDNSMFTVTRLH